MTSALQASLVQHFSDISVDIEGLELLPQCVELCETYRLSAEKLATEWEAFTLSNGDKAMSYSSLKEFSTKALQKYAKTSHLMRQQFKTPAALGKYNSKTLALMGSAKKRDRDRGDELGGAFATPLPAGNAQAKHTWDDGLSPLSMGPSPQYLQRQNEGKVELEMNPEGARDTADPGPDPGPDPDLDLIAASCAPFPARRMWESLEAKAKALDDRAQELGLAMCEANGFSEPSNVLRTTVEDAAYIGRIVCDSEGKLNVQSIFLETTRRSSGGCRVRLDLTEVSAFSLFPGQVVAIVGTNPRGSTVAVRRLVMGLPRPPPEPTVAAPLRLLAASGPFTTEDSLTFDPLKDVLAAAEKRSVQTLVLTGPFLDEGHPAIAGGKLAMTFEEVFQTKVIDRLNIWLRRQRTLRGDDSPRVLLIPSTSDVLADVAFPQAPMDCRGTHPSGRRVQANSPVPLPSARPRAAVASLTCRRWIPRRGRRRLGRRARCRTRRPAQPRHLQRGRLRGCCDERRRGQGARRRRTLSLQWTSVFEGGPHDAPLQAPARAALAAAPPPRATRPPTGHDSCTRAQGPGRRAGVSQEPSSLGVPAPHATPGSGERRAARHPARAHCSLGPQPLREGLPGRGVRQPGPPREEMQRGHVRHRPGETTPHAHGR